MVRAASSLTRRLIIITNSKDETVEVAWSIAKYLLRSNDVTGILRQLYF